MTGQVLKQIWPLTVEEIRDVFSKKRSIIFFFLYMGMVLYTMYWVAQISSYLDAQEGIQGMLRIIGVQLSQDGMGQSLDTFYWPIETYIFQLVSIWFLPFWVSMISCDMISTDRNRGTLRFVLLRCFKSSYYLSKYFSHFIMYAIFQIFATIVFLFYWTILHPDQSVTTVLGPCVQLYGLYLLFLLCLIAVTQTMSSFSIKTVTAMIMCISFWFIAFILAFDTFKSISPFGAKVLGGLVLPQSDFVITGIINSLAWFVGLTVLGYSIFSRKEF